MAGRGRKVANFLGSPRLAVLLMAYLGIVSFVGTLVPQGDASNVRMGGWVAAHPQLEPVAQTLGLHYVYTSWYFTLGAVLLAASTGVCAWRRTRVARSRFAVLRSATAATPRLPQRSDFIVAVAEPLPSGDDSAAALEAVSQRLAGLGVRGSVGGDTFVSASSRWTVWGSPVFHWALVVVFLTVSLGSLFRAEGLMGVPEGASVPDEAASYRVLTAGPLHQWPGANRTISVVSLDPDYKAGGIARGPAPQVSVSNASGAVLRRQVVYPNNALHIGSLTIHTGGFGLSTRYKLTDSTGAALGTSSAILDFPTGADRKTVPGDVALTGSDGQTALIVRSTVALDTSGTDVVFAVPKHPVTDVELLDGSGKQLSAKSLAVGESMNLPDGSTLQLQNVGYYARLSVVEDPTIPVLYAALAAALVGVAVALLSRQRLVAVVARGTEEAVELAVTARLWRNAGVSPQDLREAIAGISTDDEQESHD